MDRRFFFITGVSVCLCAATLETFGADRPSPARPFGEQTDVLSMIADYLYGAGSMPVQGGIAGGVEPGIASAADYVVGLQCANGGWNWNYENGGGICAATHNNITGPIVLGLLSAYAATNDSGYLQAAIGGGDYDLSYQYGNGEPRFSSFTPYALWQLSQVSGNGVYGAHVQTGFFDALNNAAYGPSDLDTAGWIASVQAARAGQWINLRPWEFHTIVAAAAALGQPGQQQLFIDAVLDGLDTLDNSNPSAVYSDIIGLTGGVRGLAFGNVTSFAPIVSPNHSGINGIDTLCDLADYLASLQNLDGSWYWHSNLASPVESDKDPQTTAYALLALMAAQDAGCGPYEAQIASGWSWLFSMQDLSNGGFFDYPGAATHNIEIQGEVLSALAGTPEVALVSVTCNTNGTVTVHINMSDTLVPVVGGQFFLSYDNTVLDFVSAEPGDAPFTLEVFESVNEGAGTIDYAVGVPGGGPGTDDAATMVVLTFNALVEVCDTANLVTFRPHNPPTRLTDDLGAAIHPALSDLNAITIDATPPIIVCAPNITIECDESTDPSNTGFATATDNCDANPAIAYSDSFVPACGNTGVITRTWTATDGCSNQSSCQQTITIVDTTPPSISCPGDIVVNADAGNCSANVPILPSGWKLDCNASVTATGDPSNPYVVELRSVDGDPACQWGPTGAATWTPSSPLNFQDLTILSADYNLLTGCIIGGSPRFVIGIDSDGDGEVNGNLTVHWGPEGSPWSHCPGAGWNNTGNVIASADPRWESQFPGGSTVMSYAAVLAQMNSLPFSIVKRIGVAVDASWSQDQIMWLDNVQINGTVHHFGNATATDNCDQDVVITAVRDDNLLLSDPFPAGVTTITWTATDDCGNFTICEQTVTVNSVSELVVDVQLAGTIASPITRCITFKLFDCNSNSTVEVSQELTFIGGVAANQTVLVPCGLWTCITARDELHTLRRTDLDDFGIVGTRFVADFTSGDALVGGNLNDDLFIDILDFGVFVGEFSENYGSGDTSCSPPTSYPHADVNGDAVVDTLDFSFISAGFLQMSEANCCGNPALAGRLAGPIQSISVKELYRRGLGHLAVGDVNRDGWLDMADVAAFFNSR